MIAQSADTNGQKTFPYPGMQVHQNKYGSTVLRLHYEADPEKSSGERTHVPEIERGLSPWALGEFKKMTDPTLYLQEYEIESTATLGQRIYHMHKDASLVPSFLIPEDWTRYMGLDPHPGIPHAFLWCAVDPWGDRWYYREFWPSTVCFRWNAGRLLGQAGSCPDSDPIVTIKEYVEIMKYLESEENPQNSTRDGKRFNEKIQRRVIDYAARAFGQGTNDDPEQPNFQQRYEHFMEMPETRVTCPTFDDAKKDHDVGQTLVNEGFKPRAVMGVDGEKRTSARIHILEQNCPELIYQLDNIRKQQLTSLQATKQDPTGRQIKVRNHMGDLIRYIEMSNPAYVEFVKRHDTFIPPAEGLSY